MQKLWHVFVTTAMDAEQSSRFGVAGYCSDLASQLGDMEIDDAVSHGAVVSPDRCQDMGARYDFAGIRDQQAQDLAGALRDRLPLKVDGDPADRQRAHAFGGSLNTSQPRFDAREQFADAKGFGHVIIGAKFETKNGIGFLAFCRQH
jgi:hypothetical protein